MRRLRRVKQMHICKSHCRFTLSEVAFALCTYLGGSRASLSYRHAHAQNTACAFPQYPCATHSLHLAVRIYIDKSHCRFTLPAAAFALYMARRHESVLIISACACTAHGSRMPAASLRNAQFASRVAYIHRQKPLPIYAFGSGFSSICIYGASMRAGRIITSRAERQCVRAAYRIVCNATAHHICCA